MSRYVCSLSFDTLCWLQSEVSRLLSNQWQTFLEEFKYCADSCYASPNINPFEHYLLEICLTNQ